jgi:hypothetical protein
MLGRSVIVLAGLVAAGTAVAEPLKPDAARRFVVGKTFAYNCFDGTRGTGRINSDGSVIGTVQTRGAGPLRQAILPPGTLRVKGDAVCATLRGMPFEPCFNLEKTNDMSFRGSVSGLGFAYCDFTKRPVRAAMARPTWRGRPSSPMSIQANAAQAPKADAEKPAAAKPAAE